MCIFLKGLFSIGVLYTFKFKMIALVLYFTVRFLSGILFGYTEKTK